MSDCLPYRIKALIAADGSIRTERRSDCYPISCVVAFYDNGIYCFKSNPAGKGLNSQKFDIARFLEVFFSNVV
jgi:hypothetical protein